MVRTIKFGWAREKVMVVVSGSMIARSHLVDSPDPQIKSLSI